MNDFDIRYSALRKAIIEHEFEKLNDRQKEGVFKTEGSLLILAGAGSGKTTVLINRTINLLRYGRAYECKEAPEWAGDAELARLALALADPDAVPQEELLRLCAVDAPRPYELIAITFTNKAAAELRDRLNVACGEQAADIWAHTFHSACARILRSNIEKLGYTSNFTIYDEDDKKKLLISILRELGIDEKFTDVRYIAGEMSRAKDSLITAAEYMQTFSNDPTRRTAALVYEAYEKQMKSLNALDFDDMIFKTVELLQSFPDVLAYYQHKFKYVLVDEYQDTNHAQYLLCSLLAGGRGNLCVVGDDDQSIYKFRGATIENILDFEKQYPAAVTIRLEQNYRSTATILNAANGLISCNKGRKGKNLWTDKGNGEPVRFFAGGTQEEEAQFIAARILEEHHAGENYRDFCVLYRNHVLSNSVEAAFKRNGIPYRIVSGLRFFDRAEVKDMLAYLCVIDNPCDSVRLRRIINMPARGIGSVTQEHIAALAAAGGLSDYTVVHNAAKFPELAKAAPKLGEFSALIESFISRKDGDLMELYDSLLEKTGYTQMLGAMPAHEGQAKLENVLELRSNIAEYCGKTTEPSLHGFLEEIALFTDIDRYDPESDAVVMMTIHSAKGLEFDNVFICGVEEGLFPSYRSSESPEQLEEERRLCYVAMTRARKRLYMLCAERRMLYGQTSFAKPSRFVAEIPTDCIEKTSARRPVQENAEEHRFVKHKKPLCQGFGAKLTIERSVPRQSLNFRVGQRVTHRSFGAGTVKELTPMGNDTMLMVSFDGVGEKLMMAKSASQFMTIE